MGVRSLISFKNQVSTLVIVGLMAVCTSGCGGGGGGGGFMDMGGGLDGTNTIKTQTISGQVLDENGNPKANALIEQVNGDGKVIATATSDSNGYYTINAIIKQGQPVAFAVTSNGNTEVAIITQDGDNAPNAINLVVKPDGNVVAVVPPSPEPSQPKDPVKEDAPDEDKKDEEKQPNPTPDQSPTPGAPTPSETPKPDDSDNSSDYKGSDPDPGDTSKPEDTPDEWQGGECPKGQTCDSQDSEPSQPPADESDSKPDPGSDSDSSDDTSNDTKPSDSDSAGGGNGGGMDAI